MFTKILIANRGEIACRIIRTARRMGIESVAVYSTVDADSLHVSMADSAFCIGGPIAADSYLNINAIIATAKQCGAEAIHPGYGFLSENVEFAQAAADAGIVFIGPSISAMEAMSSKQLAKQRLEKTDVPLTPGYHGSEQSDERLFIEAKRLGFPVLLKAACGGGGKGMRTVLEESEFLPALASARRESQASFADDTMLIEKLILKPRHVEIQIMADNHGQVVHLFERDCSIQRRHQKIIEEAPASYLPDRLRQRLAAAAVTVAQSIDYRGAGTVEFLVDGEETCYFMEMNTRLQVEHPVTEMITGLDLVEWQLRIAANEHLPLQQKQIQATGHAIECRIYAEDPANHFMPSIGQIHFLQEPHGEHIRIETAITAHAHISRYYDPMIAKLVVWGETREQASTRLEYALGHYFIGGVKTNLTFLKSIITQPDFIKNHISTAFLNENPISVPSPDIHLAAYLAASIDYLRIATPSDPLYRDTFAWQMYLPSQWTARYMIQGQSVDVLVTPISQTQVQLSIQETKVTFYLQQKQNHLQYNDGKCIQNIPFEQCADKIILYMTHGPIDIHYFQWQPNTKPHHTENQLTAPMPGTVVAILKKQGEVIQVGEPLMVLEAMKMEHTIRSPSQGTIRSIFYDIGAQVTEGATLVDLEKA